MKEMEPLIEEMAKAYMQDKKTDLESAKNMLKDKLGGAESKMHGTTVSRVQPIHTHCLQIAMISSSSFDGDIRATT